MSPAVLDKPRIASVDQFRGYTVAGMCLVNFLAPFLSVPAQLKHNESWFSYADSIMPSFFFVVGYSFRLTYLRRRLTTTWWQTAKSYLRRSLVLFLLSFAIYALTVDWSRWTGSGRMPPEFDAGRAMPPPTQSFETLVAQARQTASDPKSTVQNSQAVLESAGRIGEMVFAAKPSRPELQADYEAAENAARTARSEADPFLGPAIERVRAWEALGSTGRMLFQWKIQAARMLKAELWETLALIAAAQLLGAPLDRISAGNSLCRLDRVRTRPLCAVCMVQLGFRLRHQSQLDVAIVDDGGLSQLGRRSFRIVELGGRHSCGNAGLRSGPGRDVDRRVGPAAILVRRRIHAVRLFAFLPRPIVRPR